MVAIGFYDEGNTYLRGPHKTWRQCRACDREYRALKRGRAA